MIDIKKFLNYSPVSQTELTYFESESYYTRFSNSAISENIYKKDSILNIKIIDKNRLGTAQINKYDDESIKKAFTKAFESLKNQNSDKNILDLPEKQNYRKINNFDKKTLELNPVKKAEILSDILNKSNNEKISGTFTNGYFNISLCNSKGLFADYKTSFVNVSFTVEIDSSSSSWQVESKSIDNIDVKNIYNTAKEYALKNKNPQSIANDKYDVILTPYAFFELIEMLIFYGLATLPYLENRSPMNGKLGKKIASELFTLKDDVYDTDAGGQYFDYEGIPKKSVILIENGILKAFVHDRHTAKKMKTQTTGHSLGEPNSYGPLALNPIIEGGEKTPQQMISTMKKGLYIRKIHYTNLLNENELLLTGMTRDGVFYIEDGKIKYPVINMRFGDSLFNILNNIEEVGTQLVLSSSNGFCKIPWVKIKDLNFTSSTEF